ncbi:hypothetical protein AB0M95_33020 [Sphaerisporangium sp. NPDC051017]|uniref:hypothetical protein n=1 Tax=Sphaerisporangium sp. NPDC051017 TaxID=3154636 RepID=UPI00344AED7F
MRESVLGAGGGRLVATVTGPRTTSPGRFRTDESAPAPALAIAPAEENQTYCSNLVGFGQAAPVGTAKAAPPTR